MKPHHVRSEAHRPPRPYPYCKDCRSAYNRVYRHGGTWSGSSVTRPAGHDALVVRHGLQLETWIGRFNKVAARRWRLQRLAAPTASVVMAEWSGKMQTALENMVKGNRGWGKRRVSKRASLPSRSDLLHLLIRQGGACPYTGEPLTADRSTHLDHKQPRSRGGSDDISNLQWVSERANLAKRDMTHDEFVDLCAAVASRFCPQTRLPLHAYHVPDGVLEKLADIAATAACRPLHVGPDVKPGPGPTIQRDKRVKLEEALASGKSVTEASILSGYSRHWVYRLLRDRRAAGVA